MLEPQLDDAFLEAIKNCRSFYDTQPANSSSFTTKERMGRLAKALDTVAEELFHDDGVLLDYISCQLDENLYEDALLLNAIPEMAYAVYGLKKIAGSSGPETRGRRRLPLWMTQVTKMLIGFYISKTDIRPTVHYIEIEHGAAYEPGNNFTSWFNEVISRTFSLSEWTPQNTKTLLEQELKKGGYFRVINPQS